MQFHEHKCSGGLMTRGERVIAFITQFCPVPEGKMVGQSMKLMELQRKFILDIYDNKKGTSRAYLSVGRKNGKSALIALYSTFIGRPISIFCDGMMRTIFDRAGESLTIFSASLKTRPA